MFIVFKDLLYASCMPGSDINMSNKNEDFDDLLQSVSGLKEEKNLIRDSPTTNI